MREAYIRWCVKGGIYLCQDYRELICNFLEDHLFIVKHLTEGSLGQVMYGHGLAFGA